MPASDSPAPRDLDVVVFGATGFVGRLVADHLARRAPDGTRIGLAGRSADKLAAVQRELGPRAADWPLLVADSSSADDVARLARSTKVVATTVGPYLKYGLPLAQACAEAGTSYADLTGEVLFVREAADRAHEQAVASGARVVVSCGFDSIPSDLGVLLTAEQARADDAGELTDTVLVLTSMKGGLSGGTLDSMRTIVDEVRSDPAKRKVLADPYALSPDRAAEPDLGAERDPMLPGRDAQLGRWVAPFVMGPHNSRVVRRSNALTGWSYGRSFRYREVMGVGRGPAAPVLAAGVSAGLGGLAVGMVLPPTRMLLDRVLPKPGEGPSESSRESGHFRVEVHATTSSGARYVTVVAAKGDPGYAATAVMMGQSALALALDGDRLPAMAGVLTPATGIGRVLADRLRAEGFEISTRQV